MIILQALLALLNKSAGKIVNALFGWAVHALFGETSSRDQTVLSVLVAAAVVWPLLVAGLVVPRLAALAFAFAHVPSSFPSSALRAVWLLLAAALPMAIGLAAAGRSPPGSPREPFLTRVLRGFPITAGLAGAFLLMFVSVPVMRFAAFVKREKSASIPLITDASAYHHVADALRDGLARHGLLLTPARPGWWIRAPLRLLLWFGGAAFRGYVPCDIEHFTSATLVLSLYPSGILLRGDARTVGLAHALIAEAIIETSGLETTDPSAQALEREIRAIWRSHVLAGSHSNVATGRDGIARASRELVDLNVDFEQWRALYRQILQVDRALQGNRQLMEGELALRRARSGDDAPTLPSLTLPDFARAGGHR